MATTAAVRERPILFSGEMVRALLDGRKSQTRRVVKPRLGITDRDDDSWPTFEDENGDWHREPCPYGAPGDRLWVREAWQFADWTEDGEPLVRYAADGAEQWHCHSDQISDEWWERLGAEWEALSDPANYAIDQRASDRRWRPSIHMPRWASRLTLEITGVRVERVQDISEADALAEGASHGRPPYASSEREWFRLLWDSLNASRGFGWDANPWVWVIEFRRVPTTPEGES